MDAAIASGLCIGTVNMFSSGIGGGGFMLVRLPNRTAEIIDFRETAPAGAAEKMYTKEPWKSQTGGLSVAVPGEIRGYHTAHSLYGKLRWTALFEDSIRIAEEGFVVSKTMEVRLRGIKDVVQSDEEFAAIFTKNGTLLKEGDVCKRPKYAKTLKSIAADGPEAFYSGWIADDIISAINTTGGILTHRDLLSYSALRKEPLVGFYRGRKIYSSNLPASGAILISILNIMEGYDIPRDGLSPLTIHRIVEAFKHGYAERTELGDGDFLEIEERLQEIIGKDYASLRRHNVSDDQTFPVEYYQPKFEPVESPGTTHLSVVDSDRMAVAMTSTINLSFGSKVITKESGIILNDQMDDFSSPNITNAFGLPPSKNNFIRPGKRPLSSTTPTIVETNGKLDLIVGASGGSMITTSTAQVIIKVLDLGMNIQEAISSPRFHHQLLPNKVLLENGNSEDLASSLESRGHDVVRLPKSGTIADVQGIRVFPDGRIHAGSDERKGGKAAAY